MPEEQKYVLKEPQEALVDDITLTQDGEPQALSEDQVKRLKAIDGVRLAKVDADAEDPYEALTVPQLQDRLRDRDLATTGNKEELIERLRDADDNDEEANA